MKLSIHPKIIFRVPRFPLNATLEKHWESLKSLILESSKEFHDIIKDLEYHQIADQPEPVQHTIWKYFNRARHRSTPFGNFAAVGICEATFPQSDETIKISNEVKTHFFTDWSLKDKREYTYEELLQKNGCLFANSSHYQVSDNTIRYISYENGGFELSETEVDDFGTHQKTGE